MYILGMNQKMKVNMTTVKQTNLKDWCVANNRQDLIEEFSPNNAKAMEEYTYGSRKKVLWRKSLVSSITNTAIDAEWEQLIKDRTVKKCKCPYEEGKAVLVGFNDLKSWCVANNRQDLIEEFSPNNAKTLEEYTYGSSEKVWWHKVLPNGMHTEWEQSIKKRTIYNHKCPYEEGKAVLVGFNDLVSTNPELVKEWHPMKNGDKQPCNYTRGSHTKVWWHKTYFDPNTHTMRYLEWQQEIRMRAIRNYDCPLLSGSYMERFTYDYLMKNKIPFKKEYKVSELGNKRFDIFIPSMNKIIELDGIQHFTDSKEFFETNDTPFNKRVENDNLKNDYCKKHDIELLRVPYVCSNNEDEFIKILSDFLVDSKINDTIVDWYKRKEFSNYLK